MSKAINKDLLLLSDRKFAEKDFAGAAQALEQCIASQPKDANLWSNLGYTYYLQGFLDNSEQACRTAIDLDPQLIAGYSNLSLTLMAKNQYEETLAVLTTAIELEPNVCDLWVNLGLLNLKTNRISHAITAFNRAISIDSKSFIAYTNLALCLQDTGFIEKAYSTYQLALDLKPNYAPTISNRIMCAQYHPGLASSELLNDSTKAASGLEPTPQWDEEASDAVSLLVRQKNKRLRIAFCSADFRAHPVGWFLRDIFKQLSRDIDCYCYVNQTEQLDEVSHEFQNAAAAWVNTKGMNTGQLLRQIKNDNIDLLIDLSGHTAGNQLALFSQASATQVKKIAWLGFPASTGLSSFDGVILSEDLVSEAAQAFFSEPIISISGPQFVYRPPHYLPDIVPAPCLANGYITFGCFNNLSKLNDAVLVCWAELLKAVPNAKLRLKWKTLADSSVTERLLKRFHSLGIAAPRIQLYGASRHEVMLREYGEIDIALDPFPFSGALTSFEAIWMGVPVVTLYTLRPMSRQTYSINKALNLLHLSNQTPSEYVRSASNLAQNQTALNALRLSMRTRIRASSLNNVNEMSTTITKTIRALTKTKMLY